jgi:NADH:ubiquinone oxidoreductase subunit H
MQLRIGPNRVGAKGWLQPIADALKLMTKEIIFPSKANILIFNCSCFFKQLPPFPCRFNFCITPLLQEVQARGLKFI